MELDKFTFKGFDPSREEVEYSQRTFGRILEQIPIEAVSHGTVAWKDGVFVTSIEIAFHDGKFKSQSTDSNFQESVNGAAREIENQIRKWRKSRIFDTSTDVEAVSLSALDIF
ncbi:MAG: HPF/RaiA family ribosome-associated protein [Oligoflexia bacterium]|nr:HPF/RaiA family ribosome-associated protein [Oligoflexia bacterium]